MDHHRMPVGQLWNNIMDTYLAELNGTELKVLCYVLRHTIGFEKVSDSISLDQFLRGITRRDGSRFDSGVGLSKKPLLNALRSLEERQILQVERRRMAGRGNVASLYSVQLVGTQMEAARKTEALRECPTYTKALGEHVPQVQGITVQGNIDHQASRKKSAVPVVCCPPPAPDDDISEKRFKKAPKPPALSLTPEQTELVERMRKHGISLSQAHRVVQQAPPERIRQSLEYLPYRNAKNPAGYLVREVLSEGYAPPKALQAEAERKALKLRKKQEQVEQAEKGRAEEEAYRAQRQAAFEALKPDQLRELVQEARRRAVWARPEMLTDGSPVLQGLVLDLVDEGWLEGRVFKLNLPPPRGWAECRRGRLEAQEVRV